MVPATPFGFYAMQKHLTIERTRRSRTSLLILSGRKWPARWSRPEEISHLMPTLSGDVSRILWFLKAVWYGRHGEILPEFLLTVKNLSYSKFMVMQSKTRWESIWSTLWSKLLCIILVPIPKLRELYSVILRQKRLVFGCIHAVQWLEASVYQVFLCKAILSENAVVSWTC